MKFTAHPFCANSYVSQNGWTVNFTSAYKAILIIVFLSYNTGGSSNLRQYESPQAWQRDRPIDALILSSWHSNQYTNILWSVSFMERAMAEGRGNFYPWNVNLPPLPQTGSKPGALPGSKGWVQISPHFSWKWYGAYCPTGQGYQNSSLTRHLIVNYAPTWGQVSQRHLNMPSLAARVTERLLVSWLFFSKVMIQR